MSQKCINKWLFLGNYTHMDCARVCVWFNTGGWSGWGNWVECSSECGGGVQMRTRTCQSPPEEAYLCEGVLDEGRPCNSQPCIGKLCSRLMHVTRDRSHIYFFSSFLSLSLSDTSFFTFFTFLCKKKDVLLPVWHNDRAITIIKCWTEDRMNVFFVCFSLDP